MFSFNPSFLFKLFIILLIPKILTRYLLLALSRMLVQRTLYHKWGNTSCQVNTYTTSHLNEKTQSNAQTTTLVAMIVSCLSHFSLRFHPFNSFNCWLNVMKTHVYRRTSGFWVGYQKEKPTSVKQVTFKRQRMYFFRLLEISVFCKNVWALFRTSDPIQWRMSSYTVQSRRMFRFGERRKLNYKKLLAIIKTQNEKISLVPMSLKANTAVRVSNPVFEKEMLLFANGVTQPAR